MAKKKLPKVLALLDEDMTILSSAEGDSDRYTEALWYLETYY